MRVLIADKFEQSGRDGLQALGCEVSYQPDAKDDSLVEAITNSSPDVLVVRGTKVTEPMLDAGPSSWSFARAPDTTPSMSQQLRSGASTFRTVPAKTRSPLRNSLLL